MMMNSNLSRDDYIYFLKKICFSRFMDEKKSIWVRQNKGSNFFLSTSGHETIGIVTASLLKKGEDWCFPYYRDDPFVFELTNDPVDLLAAFLARESKSHSRGRMMPNHYSNIEFRIPCQSSNVGSQYLQAVGVAKQVALGNNRQIVYVSGGDGSTSQGDFHEALNFSCIHKLPILFVIQNNEWAISVPSSEQTTKCDIVSICKGYKGLNVLEIDGTNFLQVYNSMKNVIDDVRNNQSPYVVVANVPRINSHSNSDDQKKYRSLETIEADKKRDPLLTFSNMLIKEKIISIQELDAIKKQIKEDVEKVSIEAEKVPFPQAETATDFIFKKFDIKSSIKQGDNDIVMIDAINKALIEEMEDDDSIIVFGEDVAGNKGGVFGVTRSLTKIFGNDKCFNTPLAESTIMGISAGMSQTGMKPIPEIQFLDYVWPGVNQLINEVASIYYRSNGDWNCNMVVRIPYGGYIQGGPYHSQSIETIFIHMPGLKVVVPSNAADAKMLLKTAIKDPNPVVFLEHKALYRSPLTIRKEPSKDSYLEFGKANIVKEGKDITLIAWGMMVIMGTEIAKKLEKENISVEVIDLRTLAPLDFDAIAKSIKKTSKVIIAHEACKNCGFGAEIAARISEELLFSLDAPVKRVAAKDCHVPFCKSLENVVLPQKNDIENAIKELFNF